MELPVYEPGTENHTIALVDVYKIMPSVSLAVFTTYLIYLSLSWMSIRFLFFGVFLAYLLEPTMCRYFKNFAGCVCVCACAASLPSLQAGYVVTTCLMPMKTA